ncbi:hypothetical protein ACPPVO_25970 [Dactylosporangium sp. McL0621]|uniref:hypothetical protein n=1 Tax=Dactylosporangium sp. McL0621 TaxID=3415678 RepID=UPI003CF20DD0
MKRGVRVLRSRKWNLVAVLALLGFAVLCGALGIFEDPGAADHDTGLVIWGAGALLCLAGAVRVSMVGVIPTATGLKVRELLSTTYLPWEWLSHADVRANHQRMTSGPTLYNPTIHYVVPPQRDRLTVTVTALGAYRRGVAQAWANDLNAMIRQHKG